MSDQQPFEPRFMKVGILTAALQELTPREVRDADPDRAIEDWLAFARELGADHIQLSAALHPTETDVPPEAMLDPVANTLDLRQPFDKERARRVQAALEATASGSRTSATSTTCSTTTPRSGGRSTTFMLRVFDAAVLLGVNAVCGFVGRNQQRSMDQNLARLRGSSSCRCCKDAKARGLTYRVEQCPMPGWTTGDNFHNNIAYTPGTWIALHRICEKHGVGDQFRIHYDPSHAILMGQDTRSIFQSLKDAGYNFLIGGFHVKGQVIDAQGVAAWGYGGQTVERGDWVGGKPRDKPAEQVNAWKKQIVLGEHELPGTARHDPLAYLQNRTVDWLDHQLAARELLPLDVAQHASGRLKDDTSEEIVSWVDGQVVTDWAAEIAKRERAIDGYLNDTDPARAEKYGFRSGQNPQLAWSWFRDNPVGFNGVPFVLFKTILDLDPNHAEPDAARHRPDLEARGDRAGGIGNGASRVDLRSHRHRTQPVRLRRRRGTPGQRTPVAAAVRIRVREPAHRSSRCRRPRRRSTTAGCWRGASFRTRVC